MFLWGYHRKKHCGRNGIDHGCPFRTEFTQVSLYSTEHGCPCRTEFTQVSLYSTEITRCRSWFQEYKLTRVNSVPHGSPWWINVLYLPAAATAINKEVLVTVGWRQIPEMGSRVIAFTNWAGQVKMQNHIFIGTHFATSSNIHLGQVTEPRLSCYQLIAKPGNKTATVFWPVIGALLYQSSQKQIKFCLFKIISDTRIWFQMASWAILPVVVGNKPLSQRTHWWRHDCVT